MVTTGCTRYLALLRTMAIRHLIRLYDVRSSLNPPAWSPNVWKIRLILNFKRLPYITYYVAFPDIASVLSSIGAPPTRTQMPFHTVPAIVDEAEGREPVVLSESTVIASYLEKTYPTPSIFPDNTRDIQLMYVDAINQHVYNHMVFMAVPTTTRILKGRDLEYYLATREDFLGVALADMFPPEKQEAMWLDLRRGLDKLSALIDGVRKRKRSPWLFSGTDKPSYADFVLASMFLWFKAAGPEGGWDRIRGWNGGRWERFLRNLQPYVEAL